MSRKKNRKPIISLCIGFRTYHSTHTRPHIYTYTQAGLARGGINSGPDLQRQKEYSVNLLLSKRKVGSLRPDGTEVKEGDADAVTDTITQAVEALDRYAEMKMGDGLYSARSLCSHIRATLDWMERVGRLGKGAFARMVENGEDEDDEEVGEGEEEEEEGVGGEQGQVEEEKKGEEKEGEDEEAVEVPERRGKRRRRTSRRGVGV